MKKIKLLKRIKRNLCLFLILFIGLVGMCNVSASELKYELIDNYYSYVVLDGTPRLFYFKIFQFDGRPVYCIELGKDIIDTHYTETTDYESLGYTKEQMDYINLISYYGYEYPAHRSDNRFYMAAQELIWEYLTGIDVYWTNELNLNNPYQLNLESYKRKILYFINRHSIKPSIESSYQFNVSDEIKIDDNNDVLRDYEIIDDGGIPASIVNNSLYVNHEGKYVGEYTIKLKRKGYLNNSYLVYYNSNSQKLFSTGVLDDEEMEVKISIKGASYSMLKVDSKTLTNVSIGDGSLEGARYGLYDLNDNLIDVFVTDSDGRATLENLPLGKYYIKEINASYGYELDTTVYYIDITKLEDEIIVYENPIMKKLEIYKTYGDDYEFEEGVKFDILRDNRDVYATITTDLFGYASIELPFGKYIINQVNSKEGFAFTSDIEFVIDEYSDNVITYTLQDNKIVNPTTYDDIWKNIIMLNISVLLLFVIFIYFSKKKCYNG